MENPEKTEISGRLLSPSPLLHEKAEERGIFFGALFPGLDRDESGTRSNPGLLSLHRLRGAVSRQGSSQPSPPEAEREGKEGWKSGVEVAKLAQAGAIGVANDDVIEDFDL